MASGRASGRRALLGRRPVLLDVLEELLGGDLPATSFWRSGVQLSKKIELVALAMKSIAPLFAVTPAPAARVWAVTESAGTSASRVGRATGVRAADLRRRSRAPCRCPGPVEEERGAVRVLRLRCDDVRHAADIPTLPGKVKKPDLAGQVRVVAPVLPVAVEGEHALALAEPASGIGVLDGVHVIGK